MEFYSLRQREICTIVDSVGLPSHVSLPGVTSAFPATAGFLFPTRRTAYFSSTGANIYVGNATVRSRGRKKLLSFPQIQGHYRGGKTLRHPVLNANCLLNAFIFH